MRGQAAEMEEDAPRHPLHHIFFASLNAHRPDPAGAGSNLHRGASGAATGAPGANMRWFQAQGISRVPDVMLIDCTVPRGMRRDEFVLAEIEAAAAAGMGSSDARGGAHAALSHLGRMESRLAAMRERNWNRWQRSMVNASRDDTGDVSVQTSSDLLTKLRPDSPTGPPQTSSAGPLPCWRDPAQMRSFPLHQAGAKPLALVAFIREHTEQFVRNASEYKFGGAATGEIVPSRRKGRRRETGPRTRCTGRWWCTPTASTCRLPPGSTLSSRRRPPTAWPSPASSSPCSRS